MFTVTVSDSIMIAHSLRGDVFGPAQGLHGATYVVEVELQRGDLDEFGIVADIGRASTLLDEVLAPMAYRNLDDLPEFEGQNTTTEFLAKTVFERYAAGIRAGALEGDAETALTGMKITLREKPDAWASFQGAL